MEKIQLSLPETEWIEWKYEGNKVKYYPVLSLEKKITLTKIYLENYFPQDREGLLGYEYDLVGAETSLDLALLEFFTNIDTDNKDTVNRLLELNLCTDLRNKIFNFWEFHDHLHQIVNDLKNRRELAKNVEIIIASLTSSIKDALKELPKNAEDVEELSKAFSKLADEINASPIAPYLLEEGKKARKPKSKKGN